MEEQMKLEKSLGTGDPEQPAKSKAKASRSSAAALFDAED
jgi:hypothetical protein